MAIQLQGGSDRLIVLQPGITAAPATFACWFKLASLTSGRLMSVTNVDGSEALVLDVSNGFVRGFAKHLNVAAIAQTSVAATVGQWCLASVSFASSISRTVYLNAANADVDTTPMAPSGLDRSGIGADYNAFTPLQGAIAYTAKWSVSFTAADHAALYAGGVGADPSLNHPGSLQEFSLLDWPPFIERVSSTAWTVNGGPTLVADPFMFPTGGPDLRFGIATHFAQGWNISALMPLIAATGVGWIRDDLNTGQWEPTKGTFAVSASDTAWCNAAHNNGLKVVGILNANVQAYSTSGGPYADPYDPNDMENRAVKAAMSGLVDAIEVTNEPNNDYAVKEGANWKALLAAMTTQVRTGVAAVSQIPVIGLGAQGGQITNMLPLTTCDGVVYHPYDTGNPNIPESAFEQGAGGNVYEPWVGVIRTNTQLPIWETEWGVFGGSGTSFTEDMQSIFLARRFLQAMALDVEHSFYYEFKDNAAGTADAYGLYSFSGTVAKLSYGVCTRLVTALAGVGGDPASKPTFISVANGDTAHAFAYGYVGAGKTIAASWFGNYGIKTVVTSSTCTIRFPVSQSFSSSTVYNPVTDATVPLSTYTNSLSGGLMTVSGFPISDHPLLIVLSGTSTAANVALDTNSAGTGLARVKRVIRICKRGVT